MRQDAHWRWPRRAAAAQEEAEQALALALALVLALVRAQARVQAVLPPALRPAARQVSVPTRERDAVPRQAPSGAATTWPRSSFRKSVCICADPVSGRRVALAI